MSIVRQILPAAESVTLESFAACWSSAGAAQTATPGATAQDFCATLSRILLQDDRARPHPDLQALGFWLRPAHLTAMLRDYCVAPPHCRTMPLGTIFMIPPANVDALFGYGLVIALLCGNRVILRLPGQSTPAQDTLCAMLRDALARHPVLQTRLALLRYGHDDAVTAGLSQLCQLRLVWGGDATVAHIGQIPLPPLARQIGFGDRFSASVIDGASYAQADEPSREALARDFYNDMYWYDQLACAAPRLLFWLGDSGGRNAFYRHLAEEAARRGYRPDMGAAVARLNMEYLALHDLPAEDYRIVSPALTVIACRDAERISAFKGVNYGYGLLMACPIENPAAIAAQAASRDQTLTYWGLTRNEVADLAQACGGRGYDRFVPVGQALQFDPVWDGHNLFGVMTRLVRVI